MSLKDWHWEKNNFKSDSNTLCLVITVSFVFLCISLDSHNTLRGSLLLLLFWFVLPVGSLFMGILETQQ